MEQIKTDKQSLRRFGLTMGLAFLVITALLIFKGKSAPGYPAVISGLFFLVSFVVPGSLKPFYILWMRLAFLLSWVNTRIILFLVFYLVFFPIGICLRLFSRDPLEQKIDRKCRSYWIKNKTAAAAAGYERQF
ncbi:MAG: SxtJ family membrane protein [Candidatus Omnitrophica bacterium]|nr:SxtJ family membrane protein [Candidatus Omnitrophota bacterium]MDD5512428.1 SxtJ family membrane protein [Candidatus Omnitrophota bacterium]